MIHTAWRRLPPQLRQSAYRHITEALAPAASLTPAWPEATDPPYIVAGCFGAPTGLGEAARLAVAALERAGLPTYIHDLTALLRQDAVLPPPRLPPMAPGPGTLLAFVQPPNVAYAMRAIGEKRLRGKRRVGCWFWDLAVVPETWRRQIRFVHELSAPSEFLGRAFVGAFGCPVRRLILPVAVRQPVPLRHAGSVVRFGAAMDLGSTATRKNPAGVLDAWRAAFSASDPVILNLKVRDTAANPAAFAAIAALAEQPGPKITIRSGDLNADEMDRWWDDIDVVVSLHRSEAFGLVVAEAMLRCLPVISTDWSATSEYVDPEVGWPVAASLVRAHDETGRYALAGAEWAEPDQASAINAMRAAAVDAAARARKGAAGRERVLIWYWGRLGGGPLVTERLVRHLVARGFDGPLTLSLSSQNERADPTDLPGVTLHRADTFSARPGVSGLLKRIPRFRRQFREILRQARPDVIVIPMMFGALAPLLDIAMAAGMG